MLLASSISICIFRLALPSPIASFPPPSISPSPSPSPDMHPSLAHWDQPAAASSKLPLKEPKQEQPKKPRHRHSPMQLAALNELYDKTEHPSLEDRTALAERLGMYVTMPALVPSGCPPIVDGHSPSSDGTQGDKDGQLVVSE